MISTGRIVIPRRVESLQYLYVGNFTCDELNGQFATFVEDASQGYIVADFVNRAIPGVPHGAIGPIRIVDGTAKNILNIPSARMQFELGPKEGPWTTVATFVATGFSDDGRVFAFRSYGPDPGDPELSLVVEFGVSDQGGLAGSFEALKWALGL